MNSFETDLEQVSCPLCGTGEFTSWVAALDRLQVTATAFQLVRCASCSLVYQNPRVGLASIGKYYAGEYYTSRAGRRQDQAREQVRVQREIRKRQIVEGLGCAPGTVLDVGCANGDFLAEMQQSGWRVAGVEFSAEAARYGREHFGIPVVAGDLEDRPDDGTRFDLITMWGVLPHLPRPLQAIRAAARLLTDRGRLVICCANIESLAFRFSRGAWGHLDQPRHFCMYSPMTVRRLLTAGGLVPGPIAFESQLWKSEMFFAPFMPLRKWLLACPAGIVRGAGLKILGLANSLLAAPVEALARRGQRGAMLIVSATRSQSETGR